MGDVVDMKAPERVHKCETAPKWAPIKHEEGKWSLLVPTCPPTAGKPLDYMRGWVLIPLTYCPWCGDGLDGDSGEHRQAWKRLTTGEAPHPNVGKTLGDHKSLDERRADLRLRVPLR